MMQSEDRYSVFYELSERQCTPGSGSESQRSPVTADPGMKPGTVPPGRANSVMLATFNVGSNPSTYE